MKTEVTMHSEMGREPHPAVDVKIRYVNLPALLPLEMGQVKEPGETEFRTITTAPEFTATWIDEHLSERERDTWWEVACSDGFEAAESLAVETFGPGVKVYAEGRSGGWLVVHGMGDVEDWEPQTVERWAEFAKQVREIADNCPRSYLESVYANVYEPPVEAEAKAKESSAATDVAIEAFRAHERKRFAADRAARDLSLAVFALGRNGSEEDRARYFTETTAILDEYETKRERESL